MSKNNGRLNEGIQNNGREVEQEEVRAACSERGGAYYGIVPGGGLPYSHAITLQLLWFPSVGTSAHRRFKTFSEATGCLWE